MYIYIYTYVYIYIYIYRYRYRYRYRALGITPKLRYNHHKFDSRPSFQTNSTHCRVDSIDFHQLQFPKDPTDEKLLEFLDTIDAGNLFGIVFLGLFGDKYVCLFEPKPNQSSQDVDMERYPRMGTLKNPKSEPMGRPAAGPSTNVSLSIHDTKIVYFCCGFCLSPLRNEFLYL